MRHVEDQRQLLDETAELRRNKHVTYLTLSAETDIHNTGTSFSYHNAASIGVRESSDVRKVENNKTVGQWHRVQILWIW